MNTTKHADVRIQQRAIPPLVLAWLQKYGTTQYSHGAQKRYFDKQARKKLKREFGEQVVDRLGDLLDSYIVVDDEGLIITAGHRIQRFYRQ